MKKNLTELVFILDRSGSMQGLESNTIGGFNAMLEKRKREPGEAFVSTILFDDWTEVLHDRVKASEVKPITAQEYYVRGCTALLDAIGGAIHHIGNIYKYAWPENVSEHTLCVITTDGMENASRRYSAQRVKEMIRRQKGKYGWKFLFLGANIDAVETAGHLGISQDRAVNYRCDSQGTRLNYEVVGHAVAAVRCSPRWMSTGRTPSRRTSETGRRDNKETARSSGRSLCQLRSWGVTARGVDSGAIVGSYHALISTPQGKASVSSHFRRTANCSGVWNQCSPPSITVSLASCCRTNPSIVWREVMLSWLP